MKTQIRNTVPKVWIMTSQEEHKDLSPYVQSIMERKVIGATANTLSITLNPMLNIKGNKDIYLFVMGLLDVWRKNIKSQMIIKCQIDSTAPKKIVKTDDKYAYKILETDAIGFYGMIDQISESGNYQQGITFTITCSMFFPKIVMKDRVEYSEYLSQSEELKKVMGEGRLEFFQMLRGQETDGRNVFINQKPDKAIKYIIKNCVIVNGGLQYWDGKKFEEIPFYDLIGDPRKIYQFEVLEYEIIFATELASNHNDDILNYMLQCIDLAFYEVFFESKFDYNILHIRPIPYSNSPNIYKGSNKEIPSLTDEKNKYKWKFWQDLKQVNIDSSRIMQWNISTSDAEVKNFFKLTMSNNFFFTKDQDISLYYNYPILNAKSIIKYGLRSLTADSKVLLNLKKWENANKGNNDNIFKEYLIGKRERLAEWYSFPYYESGQITILGDESIELGTRIFWEDRSYNYYIDDDIKGIVKDYTKKDSKENIISGKGMEYYVTEIQHSFSYPQQFTTTLTLKRGQAKDYSGYWNKWTRNTNVDAYNLLSKSTVTEIVIKPKLNEEINKIAEGENEETKKEVKVVKKNVKKVKYVKKVKKNVGK